MTFFIVVVLAVYTLMHTVAYRGLRPLFVGHWAVGPLVMVFMALMVFAPFTVRLFERFGYESAARASAHVGFTWMGFVFLAFSFFTFLGAVRLLFWLGGRVWPALQAALPHLHGPQTATLGLITAAALGVWAILGAHNLTVERVVLETPKLKAGEKVTVAQVSDIHLGLINREEVLSPIVTKLKELDPDVILATGDVVDAQIIHLENLIALWRTLDPPLGKFAIHGNHEYYAGLDQSRAYLEASGFKVLENRWADAGGLYIGGLTDQLPPDQAAVLRPNTQGKYAVLMKHKPLVDEQSLGLFDLQLSGHTHKGQIWPFRYLTILQFPRIAGLYELPRGSRLYVNRGTGTWGPPMRLGAPPEITIFEIRGTNNG